MTNEQVIAVLKNMIWSNNEHGNTLLCIGEVQALDMAIEALTAQPKRKPVIRCWCPKCGFEMIPTIDSDMKGEANG